MPVHIIPFRELSPDQSKGKLTDAMTDLSINGQGAYVDASIVVQQVLTRLDAVVQHVSHPASSFQRVALTRDQLRLKGEFDAANEIARHTLDMVRTFNNATAPWDLQTFQMARPSTRPAHGLANSGTTTQPRPAVATEGSWAAVAAKAVTTKNSIIRYQPSDAIVKRYQEPKSTPEEMRVVWIQGWAHGRPLGQISEYVTQGPICSMAYASDYSAVCVVFQYAESAQALFESCNGYEDEKGECLFGPGCAVQIGQPYPMSEDLRRMSSPIHERRRLTFARSQMFAHGMTETRFRGDIYELVGEANVELVWLFNSGNGKSYQSPVCCSSN